MRETIKLIVAPVCSLIIVMLGNGFFNTFVSVRITLEGGPAWLTGLVYSSYYAGMMIGSLYMEKLIHRVGHIRAFTIFASLHGVAVMAQGLTLSIFIWFGYRFIVGMATAGLFIVIESWLLLLSSTSTRGKILAIYMVALYAAQAGGQFILNWVDLQSIIPFAVTVIFCLLSVLPVCFMKASYPNITESEMVSIFYLLKKSPLGFVGAFSAGLILSSFYALGPVYGKETHLSVLQISQIMGLTIFGGLILQSPLGYLSDIIERRKVIIGTAITLAIICVCIFAFPSIPFGWKIFLFILFGGFSFTLYPLSITYCCDFFSSAGITAITVGCLVIYGIGCIIGPIIASSLMDLFGPLVLFVYTGVVAICVAIFGLIRSLCRPPPSKEMHEDYIPFPRTSPQVYQLDPRTEEEELPPPKD